MCHHAHVHVTLSEEDRKNIKSFTGIMIPVYASILLAIVAVVAIGGSPRPGDMLAASSASSATR